MKFAAVLLSLVSAAAVVSAAPSFRAGATGQSAALSLRNVDTTELIAELYSRSLAVSEQEVQARDLYDDDESYLAARALPVHTFVRVLDGPARGKVGQIVAVDATGYTVRVNMGPGHTQDFEVFHHEVATTQPTPSRVHH